jgi:putative addiction module component (TIGR02574 family)
MSLDVPTTLELIGALWQSIETDPAQLAVSDELIAELDRRKEAAQRHPESLVPWDKIKHRLGLTRGD